MVQERERPFRPTTPLDRYRVYSSAVTAEWPERTQLANFPNQIAACHIHPEGAGCYLCSPRQAGYLMLPSFDASPMLIDVWFDRAFLAMWIATTVTVLIVKATS